MDYKKKYLKYKEKYLELKNLQKKQIGGSAASSSSSIEPIDGSTASSSSSIEPIPIPINFRTYGITLTDMIKELVTVSNDIYNFALSIKSKPKTYLICVGQSPGYYALSMMNLLQYNEENVKIIILPYSTQIKPSLEQFEAYDKQLKKNRINFTKEDQLIFLDQVQHGIVISNFFYTIFSWSNELYKASSIILLNSGRKFEGKIRPGPFPEIPIINHFSSNNLGRFSDSFPRIVQYYSPKNFETESMNINFINIDTNPFVQMIIDCSIIFPNIDSEWYRLNNSISESELLAIEEDRKNTEKFNKLFEDMKKR
jgi:hypothetical protein